MKNLMAQFAVMLARHAQLASWSSDLVTPFSLWLPGLFNPTSYITAVMQVTARSTGMPLDQMSTDTHVTTFLKPEFVDYYPTDGAFVHGLYIEGARWPTGEDEKRRNGRQENYHRRISKSCNNRWFRKVIQPVQVRQRAPRSL